MGRYFVYELIDPRNGTVFYIGKGCGDRPAQHTREAKKGKQTAKCRLIREILDSGQEVTVNIVRRYKTEAAAYSAEKKRIAKIGIDNLTNMHPGGAADWAKADPDAAWLKVIAQFALKTNGLKPGRYRWWFGQQWHYLPDNFISNLRDNLIKMVERRGAEFVRAGLLKSGVRFVPETAAA